MIVPGYYDNFVRRVLDNHVQGIEANLEKEPETKIPYTQVKGLLCILPEGRSAGSARELGTTQTVITDYGIQEISIGGQVGKRLLSYKGGYFIDWCRCVNSLIPHEDSTYQIGVFERILSKEYYFRPSANSTTGPLASVVEWDDAMAWLGEVVRAEKEGRPTPLLKKKPRASAVRASTEPTTPTVERPNLERAGRTVVVGPGPSPPPVVVVQKKLSFSHFLTRARGKSADPAERNGATSNKA
ncbi:hypothetical protein NEMBOFW57_000164 [Staphylotrichum longicolle]|uniref:Uncharacterized protein n=1 Tax=Staphylotrichum longicolle TaxID=669026 RepID=A0AAD4EZ91_9PEZI|nr:hypothetical protein NEMBOFW57_000164 [Staphylotrichum longicolle]